MSFVVKLGLYLIKKLGCIPHCAEIASEYLGSISRIFHAKISQHTGKSHHTGFLLSAPSLSNVRLHTSNCGMTIRDSDFKILSSCKTNLEALLILRFMFILKLKPKVDDSTFAHKLLIC